MTSERGAVAACGLAQGTDLPGSVAPFVLRGVVLPGTESVRAPRPLRKTAWDRAFGAAGALLVRRVHGRVVIDTRA